MAEAAIADDLVSRAAAYTPTGEDEAVPGTIQALRRDGVDDVQQARCVLQTERGLVDLAWARMEVPDQGGKAWFDYNDVKALFGNRPSNGHAYDLMEIAAELDGFEYGTFHGEKRLRANLEAVNDDAVLHAANNNDPAEVS